MQITSGHGLDALGTTPATRLGSGGTTLIAPTSAAVQVATTRSSTLLYARPAFLSIPLGSLGTVAVRGKACELQFGMTEDDNGYDDTRKVKLMSRGGFPEGWPGEGPRVAEGARRRRLARRRARSDRRHRGPPRRRAAPRSSYQRVCTRPRLGKALAARPRGAGWLARWEVGARGLRRGPIVPGEGGHQAAATAGVAALPCLVLARLVKYGCCCPWPRGAPRGGQLALRGSVVVVKLLHRCCDGPVRVQSRVQVQVVCGNVNARSCVYA